MFYFYLRKRTGQTRQEQGLLERYPINLQWLEENKRSTQVYSQKSYMLSRIGKVLASRRVVTRTPARTSWVRLPQRMFSEAAEAEPERESMEYDVVTVGAGPAGLSAAIRVKQLAMEAGVEINVCVIDKGAESLVESGIWQVIQNLKLFH